MKSLALVLCIMMILSCNTTPKVLYQELSPDEFKAKLAECPVAYLPLGTLEWHGEHLPLGSDGLQAFGFFKILSKEAGGIVMPMLFMGPDISTIHNGAEYYGMDFYNFDRRNYGIQQLTGSAYWVPDATFDVMINGIMKQFARAGFKIVVAHGHGPSNNYIQANAAVFREKYNIVVMTCWGNDKNDLCLMCDHAAANETSIMMYLYPELVHLEKLPADTSVWPKGIAGNDPRIYASSRLGKEIIAFEVQKMKRIIRTELSKLK